MRLPGLDDTDVTATTANQIVSDGSFAYEHDASAWVLLGLDDQAGLTERFYLRPPLLAA
jgi:hypothetical protein